MYAAIEETVQTTQPGPINTETQPFASALPRESTEPCCWRGLRYIATVCICVFHFCGAVCECNEDDDDLI
ncbi:hypothetical protein CAEBREN_08523 [Caenorhabditis brenneri]|uniref:Uncharacterized protein n=1 Tax=Caenorhabditis brenneri TaxID=135651 RepID=G0N1Y7_CAEBE|nr:hypothetical protein CAEBREN_08523 [Caenorhabditis brenneri]